jgi:hypothetical protein
VAADAAGKALAGGGGQGMRGRQHDGSMNEG